MNLLYVGDISPGCRAQQRRQAFERLGLNVDSLPHTPPASTYQERGRPAFLDRVRHRLGRPRDLAGINPGLVRQVGAKDYDLVWIDKAPALRPEALAAAMAAAPRTVFAFHSEDDHFMPHNQWSWLPDCLSLYDVVFTTKRRNATGGELTSMGARDVRFHFQSFDPTYHRPIDPTGQERDRFFADAGFLGTFEEPRAEALLALARAGIFVRVFGRGWEPWQGRHALMCVEPRELGGREYLAAMSVSSLQLGFLRRANRDEHTCRSFEIPACGAAMVAERSDEHSELFQEGVEAVFFSDHGELIESVTALLADRERRSALRQAGRARCLSSGYDHDSNLTRMLEDLVQRPPARFVAQAEAAA